MTTGFFSYLRNNKNLFFIPWLFLSFFIIIDLLRTWHFQGFSNHIFFRELTYVLVAYYSWLAICMWQGYRRLRNPEMRFSWPIHSLEALSLGAVHLLFVCVLLWVITPEKVKNAIFYLVYFELFYRWIVVEVVLYFASLAYWAWKLPIQNAADQDTQVIKTSLGHLNCDVRKIMWLKSSGNYINFWYKNKAYKTRSTLKAFKELLGAHHTQIHRSTLINLSHIDQVEAQRVIMQDGTSLPISQNKKQTLMTAWNQSQLTKTDQTSSLTQNEG